MENVIRKLNLNNFEADNIRKTLNYVKSKSSGIYTGKFTLREAGSVYTYTAMLLFITNLYEKYKEVKKIIQTIDINEYRIFLKSYVDLVLDTELEKFAIYRDGDKIIYQMVNNLKYIKKMFGHDENKTDYDVITTDKILAMIMNQVTKMKITFGLGALGFGVLVNKIWSGYLMRKIVIIIHDSDKNKKKNKKKGIQIIIPNDTSLINGIY